jgi:hypothetical protein
MANQRKRTRQISALERRRKDLGEAYGTRSKEDVDQILYEIHNLEKELGLRTTEALPKVSD